MWQLNDKAVSLSAAQATQELALSRVRALEAERAHLKQVRSPHTIISHAPTPIACTYAYCMHRLLRLSHAPCLHPAFILYAQALETRQRDQPSNESSRARFRCTWLSIELACL